MYSETLLTLIKGQQLSKANFSCYVLSSYGQCSVKKLAGDLLLGLKFVKLEIISTSFIDFLYDKMVGLQRYIFPRYDTYPDTVVTIRYIATKQEGNCLMSCSWAQMSVQLTSLVLNITLNTAQRGFFSSVCSENRSAFPCLLMHM